MFKSEEDKLVERFLEKRTFGRKVMSTWGVGALQNSLVLSSRPGERAASTAADIVSGGVTSTLGLFGVSEGWMMFASMATYELARHGIIAIEHGAQKNEERWRNITRLGFQTSDVFNNSSRTLLTQRQQSLRAIQTSILNARSSMGNEAALMRRSVDEYL